jgi:carboxypeptidase Taq
VEPALTELKARLSVIDDLERARSVLDWDLNVWMPPNGHTSRGAQLATLEVVVHERQIDDRIGELLDELEPWGADRPPDSDDACLLRVARRDWVKQRRIPTVLAAAIAEAEAESFGVWVRAREESDFALFRPALERMVDLKLQWIECFAPYDDPYDVLLDDYDEGLTSTEVAATFDVLQPELTALVAAHADAGSPEFLAGPFAAPAQDALSREIVEAFGATWESFRLDVTPHPFAVRFGPNDIRLTTAYSEDDLGSLFTAMHEAGHGLYEWGSARSLDRTPLVGGRSSTLHESQSRLWENAIGRSLPFWRWFYPRLRAAFGDTLGDVELDRFFAAINRVERSYIRIDADETSYGLHVILRFELERRLVTGELTVADLPEAWNARFEELMGIAVPDDRRGVLQDVHWSVGLFGYFPTYLLGSVLSVQIWERLREALPDVDAQMEQGDFSQIHGWLRENLYELGSKLTPTDTIERVAGGPIDPQPYLRYLRDKLSTAAAA